MNLVKAFGPSLIAKFGVLAVLSIRFVSFSQKMALAVHDQGVAQGCRTHFSEWAT